MLSVEEWETYDLFLQQIVTFQTLYKLIKQRVRLLGTCEVVRCQCLSGGASSENSPGPGKVLEIFGRSFYRGVFGCQEGGLAPAPQGCAGVPI